MSNMNGNGPLPQQRSSASSSHPQQTSEATASGTNAPVEGSQTANNVLPSQVTELDRMIQRLPAEIVLMILEQVVTQGIPVHVSFNTLAFTGWVGLDAPAHFDMVPFNVCRYWRRSLMEVFLRSNSLHFTMIRDLHRLEAICQRIMITDQAGHSINAPVQVENHIRDVALQIASAAEARQYVDFLLQCTNLNAVKLCFLFRGSPLNNTQGIWQPFRVTLGLDRLDQLRGLESLDIYCPLSFGDRRFKRPEEEMRAVALRADNT